MASAGLLALVVVGSPQADLRPATLREIADVPAPRSEEVSLKVQSLRPRESKRGWADFERVYQNRSDHPITLVLTDFWNGNRLVVTDRNGTEPPLTALGKSRREAFTENRGSDHVSKAVLAPGEKLTIQDRWDPSKLYRLRPGRFFLSLESRISLAGRAILKAAPIPLDVR